MSHVFQNLSRLRASFVEQASTSAGSFVFYLIAARISGPDSFGLFAMYLVPAQIVHSVAVQWVLLPITTTPGRRPPLHLLTAVAKRLVILTLAAPPFAAFYSQMADFKDITSTYLPIVTGMFIAMALFDVTRYLAIRLGRAALQATCNIIRWLTSFIVLLSVGYFWMPSPFLVVSAFVVGMIVSLVISLSVVVTAIRASVHEGERVASSNQRSDSAALLSLGLANAFFTLASSSALARASLAAFGAIQAFRSLVNWAPLILQYLETHFASSLAREDKTAFTNVRWLLAFLSAGVLGEFVIFFAGEWILKMTVGAEFVQFLWLFGIMFALVLVQSYTRTVGIEVRLSGAIPAIWMQSALLVAGAVLIGGWMSASEVGISTYAVISIMVATAVLQAVAMTIGLRIHRSRAARA